MHTTLITLSLCALPALAAAGEHPTTLSSSAAPLAVPTDQVWIDAPGDGRVWARGADWKASFGPDGFVFHPFLGADAPRTEAARLAPRNLAVGGRELAFERQGGVRAEGRTVTITRGAFDEVYHLRPEGVEQTFVVRALPTRGELVLSLALESELECGVAADGALELVGPRGGVRYGAALALDAAGARRALETRPSPGGLELRVPREFVAAAYLPLVIDPWISTISVAQTSSAVSLDLAHDAAFNRACLVVDVPFSAVDHDVYSILLDAGGAPIPGLGVWVDYTVDSWFAPRVAANQATHNFMCVATVRPYGSSQRLAKGRVRSLTIPGQTPQRVYGATPYNQLDVCVGGASEGSPSRYLVAWTRLSGSGLSVDIQAQLVDHEGLAVGSPQLVSDDGMGWDRMWEISPGQGGGPVEGRCWNLVGSRGVPGSSLVEAFGAQIAPDGTWLTPPFSIGVAGMPTAVSPPLGELPGPREWMVVTSHDFQSPTMPLAATLLGDALLGSVDLNALTGAPQNSWFSGVVEDAGQLVLTWVEPWSAPGGGSRLQATTLWAAGGRIGMTEWPATLYHGDALGQASALAARSAEDGGCLMAFLLWGEGVELATYAAPPAVGPVPFCAGDGSAGPCPCGNDGGPGFGCANSAFGWGAYMQGYGQARVSNDQLGLWASYVPPGAVCLYMQGTTAEAPLPFDDGLLCVRGDTRLLGAHVAVDGTDCFPGAGDPGVAAAGLVPAWPCVRTYQVRYRDDAPLCAGGGWNATGAVEVVWLP